MAGSLACGEQTVPAVTKRVAKRAQLSSSTASFSFIKTLSLPAKQKCNKVSKILA
jgi:hypothetical protein